MRNIICLLWCLLSLASCSGLFDSLKEESEEAEREAQREEAFYSNNTKKKARELSANSVRDFVPETVSKAKRVNDFDLDSEVDDTGRRVRNGLDNIQKRRFTRSDFVDGGGNENSLWNSQGQSNYFFSQNNRFDPGDLVIVDVDSGLRREIQYSLWRSLPADERRIQKKRSTASEESKPAGSADKKETPKEGGADEKSVAEDAAKNSLGNKDGDLIRMEVVENMGNGLVRLQGQKRVIYRGRPKFVEVSGLARGRDIDDQSRTNSKTFLDMRTRVVQ